MIQEVSNRSLHQSLMEDLLYLDTARIGQISPSAALACDAVTRLANDDPRQIFDEVVRAFGCLLYTSPSPRDRQKSRMPSSA